MSEINCKNAYLEISNSHQNYLLNMIEFDNLLKNPYSKKQMTITLSERQNYENRWRKNHGELLDKWRSCTNETRDLSK